MSRERCDLPYARYAAAFFVDQLNSACRITASLIVSALKMSTPSRFIWLQRGSRGLDQIVCALRFFYGVTLGQAIVPERIAYAREPSKLPVVLSADEVVRFLEAIPSLKSRTALTTVYAAGLRVSEVVLLKIADIDSQRMVIRVEQGTLLTSADEVIEARAACCGANVAL